MPETFDPYHKWLGISPKDQPPNHYRLLGIDLFEGDQDVIEAAVELRTAHVRNYQIGKHSDLSQKLLKELATAKVCLLVSEKKAEYDKQLRQQLQPTPLPASATGEGHVSAPAVAAPPVEPTPPLHVPALEAVAASTSLRIPRRKRPLALYAALGLGAALLAVFLAAVLFSPGSQETPRSNHDRESAEEPAKAASADHIELVESQESSEARAEGPVLEHPGMPKADQTSPPEPPPAIPSGNTGSEPQAARDREEEEVFLADLQETNVKVQNRWFSKNGKIWGKPIEVNGQLSPKGIFMHPSPQSFSRAQYILDGRYKWFVATAAVPTSKSVRGDPVKPIFFQVLGDGNRLWRSPLIGERGATAECRVNISGVRILELKVQCTGWDNWAAAVWMEPRVISEE